MHFILKRYELNGDNMQILRKGKIFSINSKNFRADLIAGIIVAVVLIPQSIAYAQLAGLPAQYGLYSAVIPCIIAALTGASSHLSTGPVALISITVHSVLSQHAKPHSEEYIKLAGALCLLSGIIMLAFSLLKLGRFIQKTNHAIIKGFSNGIAIMVIFSQLNKILPSHFNLNGISNVAGDITVLISGLCFIHFLKRLSSKIPRYTSNYYLLYCTWIIS